MSEMPICGNPECGKEISEGRTHCNKACFDRDYELRRLKTVKMDLSKDDDIWLGQRRRRRAMEIILGLAKEMCPVPQGIFVSAVSYRTGLSRRKIGDDYLVVLLDVGHLRRNDGMLHLTSAHDGDPDEARKKTNFAKSEYE